MHSLKGLSGTAGVTMPFWWDTVAVPILEFMRHTSYPDNAVEFYGSFLRNEILPLLGPFKTPGYRSWMTDDHTPVEFSLLLGEKSKSSVRFAIEPVALSLAEDRLSIATLRSTLQCLSSNLTMKPLFDLQWFDICADELLLVGTQTPPNLGNHPASEIFIGFDCAHDSTSMKVYFMPKIRALASKETPMDMMERLTHRLRLDKPWAKILEFLTLFLPGDRPEIDIVAIDCVPGAQNRLKIYFRTDILSYSHMEYFLTLGGALSHTGVAAGLQKAEVMWNTLTQTLSAAKNTSPSPSRHFHSGLIYYELKQDDDFPSAKIYLPVRNCLPNDLEISEGVERIMFNLSECSATNSYLDFMQRTFSHRDLSTRTGIHTYVTCAIKRSGSDITVYYNPEAFAPERSLWNKLCLSSFD